jgi:hypothetical protein
VLFVFAGHLFQFVEKKFQVVNALDNGLKMKPYLRVLEHHFGLLCQTQHAFLRSIEIYENCVLPIVYIIGNERL